MSRTFRKSFLQRNYRYIPYPARRLFTDKIGWLSILFFLCCVSVLYVYAGNERAEALDTVNGKVISHYIQAGIYERLEEPEKAIQEYQAALKADATSPQLHLRLAVVFIKENQFEKAVHELKLAIKYHNSAIEEGEHEPPFVTAHTLLALIYSLQGKTAEATVEYEKALRGALVVDPQNVRVHKSLAEIYIRENKLSEAEKAYRLIIELTPADYEAHFFLGSIYEQQDRREEAIEEFKIALKLNPEYDDALNSLGYLYAEESTYLKEAEEMINRALMYQPNNGAYIDSLGWVYFKQGRSDEAIQLLERAITLFPDPVIYEHLGDAYLKKDDVVKAKEYWQKALEMDDKENKGIKDKLEQYK